MQNYQSVVVTDESLEHFGKAGHVVGQNPKDETYDIAIDGIVDEVFTFHATSIKAL